MSRRQEARSPARNFLSISWTDANGIARTDDVVSVDVGNSGLAFKSAVEIPVGTTVYIDATESSTAAYCLVRHCTWNNDSWNVGVELESRRPNSKSEVVEDYYELLQISPTAQDGTIHRVFRYLAGLYHPDNPQTGDPDRFLQLNRAYKVLSDPESRAHYDAALKPGRNEPLQALAGVDYMDGVEGEMNRRLAVLAVLYRKCRSNINDARVTLAQLERQMGFPREYLDFTTWYLKSKKYITREDNSDFALTAAGVDFVEENYSKIPLLRKMLNSGTSPLFRDSRKIPERPMIMPVGSSDENKAGAGDGKPELPISE